MKCVHETVVEFTYDKLKEAQHLEGAEPLQVPTKYKTKAAALETVLAGDCLGDDECVRYCRKIAAVKGLIELTSRQD